MEHKKNHRTSASARKGKGKERTSLAAQQAQRLREERLAREQAEREREARRRAQEQRASTQDAPARREPEREAPYPPPRPPQAGEPRARQPKPRDSRAAQTAKRRKLERQERRQMDGLREKQIRQAKRRTRKRISRATWRRIFIMGGVVLAVILSMVIFFRCRHITVQGGEYYSQETILQASGIAEGDNLLLMSRGEIAGNILAQLPLVRSVQVTKQLPNTVIITVSEDAATYAVSDEAGHWYLMSAAGKSIAALDDGRYGEYLFVENLTINTPKLGEPVSIAAPKGKEVAAQAQLDALLALLDMLGKQSFSDLTAKVISVSVPSAYKLSLLYDDRFTVELGEATQLEYKLAYLKRVISEQKEYASGSIDLTLSEGTIARVSLDE